MSTINSYILPYGPRTIKVKCIIKILNESPFIKKEKQTTYHTLSVNSFIVNRNHP